MKFEGTLISVKDMEKSLKFYKDVFGLEVISDFGANKTLTGEISLQTDETWRTFINRDVSYGGNSFELYFEEDDFDAFMEKLADMDIDYVHPVIEHPWGQRGVRIYDPDKHIIEIGENMVMVVRKFIASGMGIEETAKRMDVPVEYIRECME